MNSQKQEVRKKWRIVLYLSILFTFVLLGQDLIRELVFFRRDIDQFSLSLQEDLKESLKSDVEAKENLINFQLTSLEEDFRLHIKSNLHTLNTIIDEAIILNNETLTEEQAIAIVERFQEADDTHSYTLVSKDWELLYQKDKLSSMNLLECTDVFGRPYYYDISEKLKMDNEVFIDYYLEEDDRIYKYTAYAEQLMDGSYILVTSEKEDHYKSLLKEDLIQAIKIYGQEATGDLFAYEQHGQILFHQEESFIGLNVLALNNSSLEKAKRVMDFVVTNAHAGFVQYSFQELNVEHSTQKIAYVTYIEELDLVIGSSIEEEYFAPLLTAFEEESFQRIFLFKVPMYLLLLVIAFAIFYFIKNNINHSLKLLKEEETLYHRFADLTNEIILITNLKGEISFLNSLGERTLNPDQTKENLHLDAILKEEESYYIMHAPKQTYYVQYNVDDILYHGEASKLYVFQDITENVESLRAMRSVSTKDELTSLGNRRSMNADYQQVVFPQLRNGVPVYLGMIDLDYFKRVNDTYGHVYGDQVLRIIADIMQEVSHETFRMYRIGGDEFALFAWKMSKQEVIKTLNDMRERVEEYPYEKPIDISFSAGISTMHITDTNTKMSEFYHQADEKLYQAKSAGKQKTVG